MVERKISKGTYIAALIFATLIFTVGVFVGNLLANERTTYLKDAAYNQQMDYRSLELQSLFISSSEFNNESCAAFRTILEKSLRDVAQAQAKVEMYMKQKEDLRYNDLKREYAMAQIRYLLLDKKVREICDFDSIPIIYFYSNEDCNDCSPQGTVLTYLKEKLGDKLLVFSLDVDFKDEPLIDLLRVKHNVTEVPSIVIDEKTNSGLITREKILEQICPLYSEKPELCK